MPERGGLFVISGPSGSGKSTIIGRLLEKRPGLYFSVSATTRAPRTGERDGVSYFFRSREEFEEMISRGELLERAEYAGSYYGTPAAAVEEMRAAGVDVLLDIEVQGARQVRKGIDDAVFIFVTPLGLDALESRLRLRATESEEKILRRMETARQEYNEVNRYDYVVINDELDRAVEELNSIITAESCRLSRRGHIFEDMI